MSDPAKAEKTGWSLRNAQATKIPENRLAKSGKCYGQIETKALSSYPKTMRNPDHRMRQQHSGWEPNTIYEELRREGREK